MRDVKAGKTAKDGKPAPRTRVIVRGGAGAAVKCVEVTKTGKSVRPLAPAALGLIVAQPRQPDAVFVFPAETGEGFYLGTKRFWPKVVKRAKLPGVTPHTLRHTIGSAAVSSGETLAMTGALLGHANARSTSLYAHMQQDPARRAADRVVGPIATALGVQVGAAIIEIATRKKQG